VREGREGKVGGGGGSGIWRIYGARVYAFIRQTASLAVSAARVRERVLAGADKRRDHGNKKQASGTYRLARQPGE